MSSIYPLIAIFFVVTIFGLLVLILPILKFYWGDRGKPPATGEERRRLREEELKLRAKQIEHSKNNPIVTRKSSFWDNRKVYKNENVKE